MNPSTTPAKNSGSISYIDKDGSQKSIAVSSLVKWTTHHGTASCGTKVRSLKSTKIGLSTIVQDGNGNYSSFKTAELEVMSKDLFAQKF